MPATPSTPATRRPIAGARQRAHADVRAEIVAAASRQLGTVGAAGLSLRAIARELGMVSSALYRYFASRDELLTALIIEAYDDLGAVAERSIARSRGDAPLARWVEAASAVRRWALDHPQEYALLYGSPVPGYAAPADTIVPGTRVTRALIQIVHDALDRRFPRPAGRARSTRRSRCQRPPLTPSSSSAANSICTPPPTSCC